MARTVLSPLAPFMLVLTLAVGAASAETAALDMARIDEITGLKGSKNQGEGIYKITAPRVDVKATFDGTALPPFMGP